MPFATTLIEAEAIDNRIAIMKPKRPRIIFEIILDHAKGHSTFTPRDLYGKMDPLQAIANCRHLYATGELERVEMGKPGRGGLPPVYRLSQRTNRKSVNSSLAASLSTPADRRNSLVLP